jgi:hypothetical protein
MTAKFPSLENSKCQSLTVCGRLRDSSPRRPKQAVPYNELVARYRIGKFRGYVRVVLGGPKGQHFHVDVVPASRFGGQSPRAVGKLADIRKVLKELNGRKIETHISGDYDVAIRDVPPPFRTIFRETDEEKEGRSVRVTGVEFALDGDALDGIRLSQPRIGADVHITVETSKTTSVDDDYLVRCLAAVDEAFTALMSLGERKE